MGDFVDIIGYEGLYRINRNGDVWSCRMNRLMKPTLNSIGYLRINLNKKQYLVHRLLALQFLPNPNNFPMIDHIDRNSQNNNLDNLRWCSKSTNEQNTTRRKNNTTGFKNIHETTYKSKNGFINEYWVIKINIENFKCGLYYNKSNYTLEQVVEFRNKIYIDNNIQQYD
jgi:hypothetical protein